jgi:hypothetical protein
VAWSLLYLLVRSALRLVRRPQSEATTGVEIAILRHQLKILKRQIGRPSFRRSDRVLLAAAARVLPRERWASFFVTPQTLLRWHRELVRRKWTYPSTRVGRPSLDPETCELILRIARENPPGDTCGSKGSSESLVSESLPQRSAGCFDPIILILHLGGPGQPGRSSFEAKQPASSPRTSSRWRPCG